MPYDPNLDAYIKDQVSVGTVYEEHVGECLIDAGIPCTFTRPGEEKKYRWRPGEGTVMTKSQKDIRLPGDMVVEVKALNYYFTSKRDFPFNPLMVETVFGYDSKDVEPIAYVNVSQKTRAKVAFWVADSRATWTQAKKLDRKRGYESLLYWVSTDWLVGWELFVSRLHRVVWGEVARHSFTQGTRGDSE